MHTYKQPPHKRMTISIDAEVYDGLVRVVGRRKISQFIEDLARPHVVGESLNDAYAAMAQDEERERDAAAWTEGLIGDVSDAAR
jgi:predicted CopG family antitoxin